MATSPLGGFVDLTPYIQAQALRQAQAAQPVNSLEASIRGFQQAQLINNLPQKQLSDQIALQLQQANLQNLQARNEELANPELALNRRLQEEATRAILNEAAKSGSLVTQPVISPELATSRSVAEQLGGISTTSPTYPGGDFTSLVPALGGRPALGISGTRAPGKLTEVSPGASLIQINPDTGQPEVKYTAPNRPTTTSLGPPQFVKSLSDPKDVRLVHVDESGQPPQGYEFLKTAETGMKPSEKITAQREVRTVYDELPAKIDFFGKGQMTGSNQLKTRLDAVLNPVKGDFTKLNPQAKQTFVFALNKLRDPTSATLLAEARQIADKAGIGDRFGAFIEGYTQGDPLPDQVAKDIYDVISQVHAVHKENLINSLIPLKDDADLLNKKLTSFGVPKDIQDEVERRIANPTTAQPQTTQAGFTNVVTPNGTVKRIPSNLVSEALKRGAKISQ